MSNNARFGHSISLTSAQEDKLKSVKKKHKLSIVKMLMATVNALDESESLVGGQPPTVAEE